MIVNFNFLVLTRLVSHLRVRAREWRAKRRGRKKNKGCDRLKQLLPVSGGG
jgi:hypothetical protein